MYCAEDNTLSKYQPSDAVQFHRILIAGDQMTAVRARSSKKHMANHPKPAGWLEGLEAMVEDWHTKASLLRVSLFLQNRFKFQVFWKLLYSAKSPSEHGKLYQLRNVINRRNVVKKSIDNFNACDDIFMMVVISHILVVAIKYLKLKS